MKVLIITFCTHVDEKIKPLIESLEHFGYHYKVLIGQEFSWGGNNLQHIAKWLRENRADHTHVLYTDAWDTVAMAPYGELIEKMRGHEDFWVYSAEKNCFPRGDWWQYFPDHGPWRYLNAGGFIAPIDLFLSIEEYADRKNENDQEYGASLYLYGAKPISLDTSCRVFQSLYNFGNPSPEFNMEYGRLKNTITGTLPIFIHGNGKVDMRSIYHSFREYIKLAEMSGRV